MTSSASETLPFTDMEENESERSDSELLNSSGYLPGEPLVECNSKKQGCCRRVLECIKMITVEPILLLDIVSWSLQSSLTTNLLLEKVCNERNYTSDICANLTAYQDIQAEVQQQVTLINMYKDLITVVPNVFFVLFIGAWSDKYGRKIPLTLPLCGSFFSTLILLANAYWMDLPAIFILFSTIPQVFTGGGMTMIMAAFAYITDITKPRSRTTRIALMDFSFVLGFPLGIWLSDIIYYELGYFGIYGISASLFFLTIMYSLIRIEDTRGPFSKLNLENVEFTQRPNNMLGDLFDTQNMKDSIAVCSKLRPNNGRGKILALMVSMFLTLFTFGTTNIAYLYVKRKFGWDYNQYVHLGIVKCFAGILGTGIVLPLLSYKLQVHDSILGIIGCFSSVASSIVTGFAPNSWYMYLSTVVGGLSGLAALVNRSILSKIVPDEEIGKVFSMTAAFETAVPLMSSPVYTLVYNNSITSFPGAVYLMTALFYVGPFCTYVWLFITRRLSVFEHHLIEENIPDIED
ncbi:probable peptidoglycan muropeptide transporter SLC46 [Macrobrachium nipponense]|uniref:probable peptidoglycan muropeptide transporter SLC46 n=1 Tax=Macrobrachium nipponense TaxID=159736 RepID=UPI0030C888BC